MTTFTGNIEAKCDEKGRIFIPAAYRKALSEMYPNAAGAKGLTLIARRDTENDCLIFYPEQVWNEKVGRLRDGLNEWDPTDQLLLMQFISEAEELEADGQGRVLIRGLKAGTYVFVGMLDRFALWNPETFAQRRLSSSELAKKIQERMRA